MSTVHVLILWQSWSSRFRRKEILNTFRLKRKFLPLVPSVTSSSLLRLLARFEPFISQLIFSLEFFFFIHSLIHPHKILTPPARFVWNSRKRRPQRIFRISLKRTSCLPIFLLRFFFFIPLGKPEELVETNRRANQPSASRRSFAVGFRVYIAFLTILASAFLALTREDRINSALSSARTLSTTTTAGRNILSTPAVHSLFFSSTQNGRLPRCRQPATHSTTPLTSTSTTPHSFIFLPLSFSSIGWLYIQDWPISSLCNSPASDSKPARHC